MYLASDSGVIIKCLPEPRICCDRTVREQESVVWDRVDLSLRSTHQPFPLECSASGLERTCRTVHD